MWKNKGPYREHFTWVPSIEPIDYITSNCYESIKSNDLRKDVHNTQYTVHNTQYTIHNTQYTIHSTQYTMGCFSVFPGSRALIRTVHIALLHGNRIERIDFEAESIDLRFLCYPGRL